LLRHAARWKDSHISGISILEACLAGSVFLLVLALMMGVTAIWDLGGLATGVRARLDAAPLLGGAYRRLPPWTFRAFGIWCIVFGIGQLIFVATLTHGG